MSAIKSALLGENFSTAAYKLRKSILFSLVQELELDSCYRCREKIKSVADLSIEHKIAWQSALNPVGVFYDLDNIAFSHLRCNAGAAIHRPPAAKCTKGHDNWYISAKGWRGCRNCRAKAKADWRRKNNCR